MANRRQARIWEIDASIWFAARAERRREQMREANAQYRARARIASAKSAIDEPPAAWLQAYSTLAEMIGRDGIVRRDRIDHDVLGKRYARPILAEHRAACDALQFALDNRKSSVATVMKQNGPRDSSAGTSGAMIDAAVSVARGTGALWSEDARVPHGTLFIASVTCFDNTEQVERLAWIESHLSLDEEKRVECHALTVRESWLDLDGVRRYRVALPSSIGAVWLDRLIGQVSDQASKQFAVNRETVKVSLTEFWVADGTRKGQTAIVPARDEIAASRSRGERQPAILASDCVDLETVCQPDPAIDVDSTFADMAKVKRKVDGARALADAGLITQALPRDGTRQARIKVATMRIDERNAMARTDRACTLNTSVIFAYDARLACANWFASLARSVA